MARAALDFAASVSVEGITTDEVDKLTHDKIVSYGAYPSPLNYAGFPKSICTSINEICVHGIPNDRPLKKGDIVSIDVSLYVDGMHGDNCTTFIVGDASWKTLPVSFPPGIMPPPPSITQYDSPSLPRASPAPGLVTTSSPMQPASLLSSSSSSTTSTAAFEEDESMLSEEEFLASKGRRLVRTTQQALNASIAALRPGACLTTIGETIHSVAEHNKFAVVREYAGHGLGPYLHIQPFVSHHRNKDRLTLKPGMVFTIEPIIAEGGRRIAHWKDGWTVAMSDGGRAAQFEHEILITETGIEVLTIPEPWEHL